MCKGDDNPILRGSFLRHLPEDNGPLSPYLNSSQRGDAYLYPLR